MNVWPQSPMPLIPPWIRLPPKSTCVLWSKVGVTLGFCALLERMHQNGLLKLAAPPIKRLPLLATSSVPHTGESGRLSGFCQVTPPSMERLNWPKLQVAAVLQAWYWNPCPVPLVLSIVNHSLSPLWAPPSGDCSIHVCPPFVERQISPQKVSTNRLR